MSLLLLFRGKFRSKVHNRHDDTATLTTQDGPGTSDLSMLKGMIAKFGEKDANYK